MSVTFYYLNYLDDASPITASSEETNFPVENIIEPFRSKVWRTQSGDILNQYAEFDCGYQVRPTAAMIINEQRGILLSETATIQWIGTNDGNWTTPETTVNLDWNEFLIFKTQSTYFGSIRFWRLKITDADNSDNYLEIGHAFLGESVSFTSTDVKLGWEDLRLDDSERIVSDGGEPWFDEKTQRDRWTFDLELMTKTERDNFAEMFKVVGVHKPFYLALDPDLKISSTQSELTRYVRFVQEPSFSNIFLDAYNVRIVVEEAI